MKHGRALVLLLALALLAGCGPGRDAQAPEGPVLWFLAPAPSGQGREEERSVHGPALLPQPYGGELEPEALLTALLAGPDQEGAASPFPKGVALRSCAFDPQRPGVLVVGLSEQYGALTDMALTLADYCIVLTLSQVEGVEQVEIRAAGRSGEYRSHQLLRAEEAVLTDGAAGCESS